MLWRIGFRLTEASMRLMAGFEIGIYFASVGNYSGLYDITKIYSYIFSLFAMLELF